jgi:putative addiction module component (TIGR02574 family)
MTRKSLELLERALALSEEERAELAGSLVQSLEPSSDEDAETAWQQEIARRAKELDAGEARLIPWEKVQEMISARLKHDPQKS